jgi:aminoglycoside 2'-N-acetyltransferase I
LLIDTRWQGLGYGRAALDLAVDYVRTRPHAETLFTSVVSGEGSPRGFYLKCGFRPTGDVHDGEDVLELPLVNITMLTTEELSAAQRAAIIELCIAAHESDAFLELFDHITAGRHFLAYREHDLVSHAVVSTRWAQPEGQPILKTAYVDAVSTHPTYQGRGYGSAVMSRLAAKIDDYEIACLQTDEAAAFYERLGWEVWRGPLAGRAEDGLVPTPEQRGVMMLRLPQTPSLDLDALLTIECEPYRIWE